MADSQIIGVAMNHQLLGQMTKRMESCSSGRLSRRQFLSRTIVMLGPPLIVPGSVLGLNGAVAPSGRIAFGGIGMGNRARFILPQLSSSARCAICGRERRTRRPTQVGQTNGGRALRQC
jgi:hypothetical protein